MTGMNRRSAKHSAYAYDGMIYACNKERTQIFCTDPTLQNKTVLFDFEQDVPAEIQESIRAAAGEYGLRGLISSFNSIDGDYLSASLADGTCMLLDRSSGEIRYYRC